LFIRYGKGRRQIVVQAFLPSTINPIEATQSEKKGRKEGWDQKILKKLY
jgi:hypothetical protein